MEKNDKKPPISEKIEIFVILRIIVVEVMKTTPHALNSSFRWFNIVTFVFEFHLFTQ